MNKDLEIVKALIREMSGLGEKKLSTKQKFIAKQSPPKDRINAADFEKLRSMKEDEGQDHEVSMANNSLDSILWAANELKKHLGDQERDIPAWIQDHITNAENYIIQAAKNFHDYGAEEEQGMEDTQDTSLSSLMEAEDINTKELSDIDHTRLVKWLAGNSNTNQYTIKKSGSGYVINTGELDKISVSGLKKYLRSQGWISDEKKVNEMSLQEIIKKVGKKYNVYSKKGKKLGSHPSKKKAQKQMAAIEISKQSK